MTARMQFSSSYKSTLSWCGGTGSKQHVSVDKGPLPYFHNSGVCNRGAHGRSSEDPTATINFRDSVHNTLDLFYRGALRTPPPTNMKVVIAL